MFCLQFCKCINKDRLLETVHEDMAGTEVTLFLKYPGPVHALQRLHHSFLECVVEYKTGSDGELQTKLPAELFSQYQVKATAVVADDEIIVEFTPKHSGVHCARLFSDTREICKPVPFLVTQRGETVNLRPDRPVKKPPAAPENARSPSHYPAPTFYGVNNPRFPDARESDPHSPPTSYDVSNARFPPSPPSPLPQSVMSVATTAAQTEPYPGQIMDAMPDPIRDFASDPALAMHGQVPGQRVSFLPQRASHLSGGSRPPSMRVENAGGYRGPGDPLMSPRPDEMHFDDLYSSKKSGGKIYGARRDALTIDYQSVVTADTLRMLKKEAELQTKVFRGGKTKRKCDICSKKVKTSKAVTIGEEDYCDTCFRRQYLLRSAIEHFMVPTIQECNIQVPINRRATRFITARKTIANVNLRGLEPADVRCAQEEFHKFDMESSGWIKRPVLMPVLKACLSLSGVQDRESKVLLTSDALSSTISTYGLDDRDEVHEIEFLGLFAFVARERERLRTSVNPRARGIFTRNDLEMAYAFRQQMGAQKRGGPTNQQSGVGAQLASPKRQSYDQRASYYIPKSQTDGAFNERRSFSPPNIAAQSVRVTPQRQNAFAPSAALQGQLFPSPPNGHSHMMESLGYQRQTVSISNDTHIPLGERLAARRAAANTRQSVVSGGDPVTDLPEEDQDEEQVPILPPDKDPSAHHTNPLIGKSPAKNKRLMEEVNKELKLTGGTADGWMMY